MTAKLINMDRIFLCFRTWAADVREGFVEITRHSLAVIGLGVILVLLAFTARPNLQSSASDFLLGMLELRKFESLVYTSPGNAASRSTAKSIKNLPEDQLAITRWLSKKYRVSNEPMAALVAEAWAIGERSQVSPTLILAIMAVESRFNPFATGSQGTVGLMQIEQNAHAEALANFGGLLSAFDPLTNLRVGVRHLQALIQQTTSMEDALSLYGASSGQASDSLYVDRVLSEQILLEKIIGKQSTASLPPKGSGAQL